MSNDKRQIGGANNKRGNRFEDFFATYKLIQLTHKFIDDRLSIRLKEQTGSPVDDLYLEEPDLDHYYQLKSGQQITWGLDDGKMEKEFKEQQAACRGKKKAAQLVVVVADEGRRKSLTENMPADLQGATSVEVFPILDRPSQLVRQDALLGGPLKEIAAIRSRSFTEYENIVYAFYGGWIDHEPDHEEFCVLGQVVSKAHERGYCRLRCEWTDISENWNSAREILDAIDGLKWWVDRGYFEWEFPPAMSGMLAALCQSESFDRFVERLLEHHPRSFLEFERLLP